MIKQKMFKLHKHRNSSSSDHKSGDDDRIDFKFLNIQAFQVPKGWDKLFVSLISAKTGKTISKSGKALVQNGTCLWTETFAESIWISRDDASTDLEQSLFKLVVSMGTARSSILGEATVNLASYMSSKASVPISLPLKKCNHGTTVQIEVQCLAPRTKLRNEAMNSFAEDARTDKDDIDNRSDASSYTFTKSFNSSSSNHTHPGEHGSRETSFSALGSLPSFDSEDSLGRENFSPQSNLDGVVNNVNRRQDSTGSQHSASYGSYHVYDSPTSNHSPYNSGISGSGKNFHNQREDLGRTMEEHRAEAKVWEKNARKLMVDMEYLRKEFDDQEKHVANMDMELSASRTECDALKYEIKHLKEELMERHKDIENLKLQGLDKDSIHKELEDEIRFQRELNRNLALQLEKTQESNLELVTVLQEMEETIEKQKMEIENLLTLKLKHEDYKEESQTEQILSKAQIAQESKLTDFEERDNLALIKEIDSLKDKIKDLERDCSELTDENLELLLQLNKLKKDLSTRGNSLNISSHGSKADGYKFHNTMKNDSFKENILCSSGQGLESSNKELESKVEDLGKEILAKMSEIEELKADNFLKEEEIETLRYQERDLKTQISDLEKLKSQIEGNVEGMELNLSELEAENVQLSERISGFEAQLRYMTDARESSRLEAQHSENHIMNLQEEINRLVSEIDAQKVDMSNKLLDMQRRWLEAQEESEHLKKANPKLQANAENLIEECGSLQKSNEELRQQRLELHKHCSMLEAELRESKSRFSSCSKKIEALEEKFSSMLIEVDSKEKTLASELDGIHILDNEHKEKYDLGESLLNKMYLEKAAEVENLQQEVAHLGSQISSTHDERERRASEAVLEMHNLRAENGKMEAALLEVSGKLELSEKKLDTIQMECDSKVLHLMEEVALSKQNHKVLVAKYEKLKGLLEGVSSNEEKLKGIVDELESKLKATDFEKLQLVEEISSLKIQLQKISLLQDEVLTLKSSLNEMKFENQRLEASLQLVSGDYEELKAERVPLVQKISSMENTVSQLEDYKRSKVALEEEVLRMEEDFAAREALCAQDAEIKNELGRIKRTSSQFQWKTKCLEEEKEECFVKVRALEEELKQKNGLNSVTNHFSTLNLNIAHVELKLSEEEENKASQLSTDQSLLSVTDKLERFSEGKDNNGLGLQKEDKSKQSNHSRYSDNIETDIISRIQFLETQLAKALEANDMYKAKLKSVLSDGESTDKQENEQKLPLLEAELIELRERYLHMSLKFAEVEAQREQLVIKLKAANGRRAWFS